MNTDRQARIQAAQSAREAEMKKQQQRDYSRTAMAVLFAARRAAGLCTRCQRPARPGKNECPACAEKSVARVQQRRKQLAGMRA